MTLLKSIFGKSVALDSGKVVTFAFPVGDAIQFGDDVIVVRLEPPRGTIFNENVYGIDEDGAQLWQIEPQYPPNWDGAWGALEKVNGLAILSNSESKFLQVEPRTGKILKKGMQVR